jgi:hypothetical protein
MDSQTPWVIDRVQVIPSDWIEKQFAKISLAPTWEHLCVAAMVVGMMATGEKNENPFPLTEIKEDPKEYVKKVGKAFLAMTQERQLKARKIGIGKVFQPNLGAMSFNQMMTALLGDQ